MTVQSVIFYLHFEACRVLNLGVKSRLAAATVALLLIAGAISLWTPDLNRAALEASYLRSPADLLDVDGVRVHVRDDGPRAVPALIMLHGLGASLHTWEAWANVLSSDFRVIRLDLPGSGLSSPDPAQDYSDDRSLSVLLALMDQLSVPRATIIGNSMGGRLAWMFAARHPHRVDKLVLISPDGFASPGFAYDKPAEVPAVLGLMRYVLPRAALRANLAPAYADPGKLTEPVVDRYYDLMRAPGAREALLQRMRQTVLRDPVPQLRQITAPTLLLWGTKDAMIPIANGEDYLQAIPDATRARLEGMGHTPQEEDPQRSLIPLKAFLAGAAPP